jgi:PAS domain S-box-containing protein
MSHRPPFLKGDFAEQLLSAIVESSDDAIISKDLDGIVTSWNKSAERIFGYSAEEMLGRTIAVLLPLDRHGEVRGILDRIRRGERIAPFETILQRRDGKLVEVAVTISPIRSGDGTIIGACKISRDITEHKRLGRADLLLAAIVSSSDDAIVSKDLQGIITSWNAGAEHLFGYTASEAIGRPVMMLIPNDRKEEEAGILERLGRGERVDHFETIRVRKDGERIPVSLSISPVRDMQGRVIGASKIARDISELKRITLEREQLLESEREARGHAEHANRMKDEFLAIVSHELRNPLNAIVGWTQVLKDSSGDPKDIQHAVSIIERNAHAQAQLINDLLDLGRIASGKMTLDLDSIEISSVMQDAIAAVQHTADLKGIHVRTIIHSVRGGMVGDKGRLQQVLWNLLANAIKFTPREGSVTVTVARVRSHVEITVADTGCGIAPEFLPHVFERFRQADASTTRQQGGLGIGLALVKHLIELHGGRVWAESRGLGQGAVFTITLPIVVSHSKPVENSAPGSGAESDHPALENLSGIRVLALDDDNDSLEVLKRILGTRQAEVRTAATADDAMKLFAAFRPHVVLSDIGMPVQDGYEFIRRVRQHPGGSSVPAAALTALARAEDRMRALQAGFQTHVAKPISPSELVAVVRSLAALHASQPGVSPE